MNRDTSIFVAGHRGLVGSAIVRALERQGYGNIIGRTRSELDLTVQADVRSFFEQEKPEVVVLAAAKVGGILANDSYPADFIHTNLQIQGNVIDSAYRSGASKLCFLGSSCIYPKHAPQPMHEDVLLTGPLEPTNEWYAIAKIAGIKMCQAYRKQYGFNAISLMPTNLYGPLDNFDLETSHVLPALIRRFHEAKQRRDDHVELWGTGTPRREFLFVDDLADAVCFLLENYESGEIINVGVGEDVAIAELAELVRDIVGFEGEIRYDATRPDGTPRKLMDVTRLSSLGWTAQTTLPEGIRQTYEWYVENVASQDL
ncbi:MAG: GDP-L-fucose synthase [Woeseiaceae bacterium]|nr:GDP-L-fucose synthase [Woeseiaceae bacterium]